LPWLVVGWRRKKRRNGAKFLLGHPATFGQIVLL
jgi:hypothetical protein